MISIDGLTVEFSGTTLFKDISFTIGDKDRIALMGKNGAGKSTLLKIIAGVRSATRGRVTVGEGGKVGYLPQHLQVEDGRTLVEEASRAFEHLFEIERRIAALNEQLTTRTDYESESYMRLIEEVTAISEKFYAVDLTNYQEDVERILLGLGFERSDFTRQTSEFSGGWRMRIELAKLLLQKPDLLLLDEPTNHLDIESIEWLEDFLMNNAKAVMVISHDKAFVDHITTRTIEIARGRIYDYKVNYSHYLELRRERREQQQAAYDNQQKMIAETREFIERFKGTYSKTNQVQSRVRMLEKLELIEVDEEDRSALNLRFPPAPRSGSYPVITSELGKAYGDHRVFSDVSITIGRGDKVAFVGRNGEGKSTMVKAIMGQIDFEGEIRIGHNVRIGYFAQNEASGLDESITVFKTVDDIAVGDIRTRIRDILGAFMFGKEASEKLVKVLSGGERTRLAMIKLLLEPVNLLILDEPTNHLDTDMTEWLEEYLAASSAALLMVTHDRYFLDSVCSDILEMENRRIYHYAGNYSYYLEKKQERETADAAQRASDMNLYRRELEWMRRQPQARATKARSRIDAFRDLESRLKTTRRSGEVRLDVGASRIGTKIFEARDVSKRFGDVVILDKFNYNFTRYEKLGIVGDNGCGKSTFLKLLTGIERPDSGVIDIGETVRFGYYSQQGLEFDDSMRVIDVVTAIAEQVELGDGRRMSASQLLQHFLFTPETQYNYVARLSGGERRRLYLCTVLMQSPNFLVLDEPTNDLDIVTLGILEEYLQAFRGCVIVVSHDRYFVDKVADHLLVFCGGGEIRDFAGTYSEYVAWKREYEAARRAEAAQARPKPQAAKTQAAEAVPRKLSFNEKRELEALETEIPALEAEKAALEASLSSGTLPVEELTAQSRRIAELIASIDEKTMRWLELSER